MIATLVVLLIALAGVGLLVRGWLSEQGFIAERVRVELTRREAERQIQHIAYAAMQKLVDEVRREQR